MTTRKYSSRAQQTTLTSSITSGDLTMTVVSGSNLMGGKTPAVSETYTVVIDPDTANEEIVDVNTYTSGNTITIVRARDGSTAVAHSAGAVVRHMVIGRDLQESNSHIEASTYYNNGTGDTTKSLHGLGIADGSVVGTSATQTLTNKTLTAPVIATIVNTGTLTLPTATDTLVARTTTDTLTNKYLQAPNEVVQLIGTGFAGYTFDVLSGGVVYITANSTANGTINFRGNGSNTLASVLAVGQSVSCVLAITNSTAYYPTAFQIDGTAVTPKWSGGTAPSAGNASAIDAYTFTLIKTAATPTYTVLAGGAVKFA